MRGLTGCSRSARGDVHGLNNNAPGDGVDAWQTYRWTRVSAAASDTHAKRGVGESGRFCGGDPRQGARQGKQKPGKGNLERNGRSLRVLRGLGVHVSRAGVKRRYEASPLSGGRCNANLVEPSLFGGKVEPHCVEGTK